MWLKNWQNPNACSINLVLSIGFIILATSNGKQKPCYMLQNGSDSHISTILKLHCCEALPISIGITPDQPACAEVQSVGSIADVALNFNMLVKNYGLVMLGNKILCIVDKFDHDGYMDVAERFAANIDPVMAILHRKMINWGSVSALKVLIKWKTLPLKHGTCDYSSLRTRMFEGEGIVTGMKY
ncbi:hypothetical protein MTR_7g062650 [Medicago truncatula]|uniref:Uncharacterized protein n=1 Tax=Medicago truncatula TaxID=3880 RepID=A0A072U0L9_MEDTR|nr:hypothetical protein MTR_7g062650 [Medicago truncatula]